MNALIRSLTGSLALVVTLAGALVTAAGQESLTAARGLYADAAYEDALLVLDRLRQAGPESDEAASAIEQYRAFCFLALGRQLDAETAIAAVVRAQPLYQPSNTEASPRLRSAFTEVRRKMLPSVVQEKYAVAKAAYDRKDWVHAERGFRQVLDVLDDPEIRPAANQSPLADVKTLALGFYDLSAAAAAPPPPPPPAEPLPAPTPVVVDPLRVYVAGDPGVIPPVAIRQFLPPFPAANPSAYTPNPGSLEVVINERGTVDSAIMKVPIGALYDRQALAAARAWEFKPATLNGKPVKFRKTVQIAVRQK